MFLKLITFLFILLMAVQAYAGRDLILFVSAAKQAGSIAVTDYTDTRNAAADFEMLVNRANEGLPENVHPLVAKLEVMNLEEIPDRLEILAAQDPRYENAQIRMVFFAGHGNGSSFHLHADQAYKGRQIAALLTSERLQPRLAKDMGIYFAACKCGESLEPTNFQVELMAEFKNKNEKLAKDQQTRSLVSIAHRFMAVATSFKSRSFGLDTILYNRGVFKVIDRLDSHLSRKLGRYISPFVGMGVAAGLFGIASALQNYVSPDAVGPAVTALLEMLPRAAIGLGVGYYALSFMSSKWVNMSEYRATDVSLRTSTLAAGDGILQMIRMSGLTCENLF